MFNLVEQSYAFMMESATVNRTNWNDVLSSPGLASPPSSASDHRRQSTTSTYQSWDDGLIGASSGTLSPDHLQEAFTPSIDPSADQTSFRLLNTKLSNAYQAQFHSAFTAANGNGLISPCSPSDEDGRFEFMIGHDSPAQWDHPTKAFASFRPAPIITPSHGLMFSTQTDTPPNTASTSFDSGIEMMTPLEPSYMTNGQQARDVMNFDASMEFYDSLPTAPVVPSQTVSGSACMPCPNLHRNDSSFSASTLADFDSSPFNHTVKAESSSPTVNEFSVPFPHYPTPSRVTKRRSGKGTKVKAHNANMVSKNPRTGKFVLHDKLRDIVLDYDDTTGYSNPARKTKPSKFCDHKINGKVCDARFERTEHLNRHRVMHTGVRAHGCPAPYHTEKDDKKKPVQETKEKKFTRHDNSFDHISKHVSAWLKELPEHKTKGSPRTDPFSPEYMQDRIIVWKGLDAAPDILEKIWNRVKKDVPGVDSRKHCFPMIRDLVLEKERTGRR
ncbi:hypothetical protein BDZ85DRAFT_319874 [Elsinoe ampelina]|uniref:C2H2-type domain-containing protein n=1 Tax=Elsinoe ampelina TaxID=302913 RepID=A0A6A6GAK2_9PEZI|nr:hypothetical protein BDZ85DRAFT_319874 [Elsinoe ampelina]